MKTGEFPLELARGLDRAFELRNRGDYREYVELQKADLVPLLESARAFIAKAEEIIASLPD